MTNREIEATNNGSERALRPGAVYRKITNGFRSESGAAFYAANQRLRRAIMDENGGGAGRLVGASRRAIVLRLTSLRWLATPISSPARAA